MRYRCWFCEKSVTSELPEDAVVRALCVCPECIEAKRITFPEDEADAERGTVHQAGVMVGGVQLCTRCGAVLTDYRGAMVPEADADKPLRGWPAGASVVVSGGNPRFMGTTSKRPTCESQ